MIYLDNAASSFPKPACVAEAMAHFLSSCAANPGRAGHRLALVAGAEVGVTRCQLAEMFGVADPSRLVFTANATDALNVALWGLLAAGDRVVTTAVEHNAVTRPLTALAARGVAVTRVRCARDGSIDLADLERELRAAATRLVVMTHASNVAGTILPIAEAARLAHAHGARILVDAAQTAGVLPIHAGALGLDLLAFPGHKALLGPTGTGCLYVAPDLRLTPLRQGGTGSRSEYEAQPEHMPDALEAGTLNVVGIVGLGAAARFIAARGLAALRRAEVAITARLLAGLTDIPGVTVHGVRDAERRVAAVSITVAGWEPVDLAAALDSSFDVAVRAGLHCAPVAHRTLGTFPQGSVRLSPGHATTTDEIDRTLAAIRRLAASKF